METQERRESGEWVLMVLISCATAYLAAQLGVATLGSLYVYFGFGRKHNLWQTFWAILTGEPDLYMTPVLVVSNIVVILLSFAVQKDNRYFAYVPFWIVAAGLVYVARNVVATATIPKRHANESQEVIQELLALNIWFVFAYFVSFVAAMCLVYYLAKYRFFAENILRTLTKELGGSR